MKFQDFIVKNALVILSVLFGLIYSLFWYILLPPINIHSFGFVIYLGLLISYVLFLALYFAALII